MAIENFNEIKEYFETNKESEDVKSFVTGLSTLNLDKVKEFVGKDKDAKSWFDSEKDTHYTKAFETWKTNNLQKIVDDEVAKAKGENLTDDQKRILELERKIAEKDKTELKEKIGRKAMDYIVQQKLPITSETLDLFVGEDEKSTLDMIKKFEKDYKSSVEEILKAKASGSYQPVKNNSGETISIGEAFAKARSNKTEKDDNKNNPYAKMWTI